MEKIIMLNFIKVVSQSFNKSTGQIECYQMMDWQVYLMFGIPIVILIILLW